MKKLFFLLIINFFPAQQSWTLQQSLDYASANHPLVKQAIGEVQKNKHRILAAKGMLLPSAEAGVNHNYSFGSTIDQTTNQRGTLNTQYDQVYAQANWELLNWRNFLSISLSQIDQQSVAFKLKQMQSDVKLNVVQMFFYYQNSRSWVEVLQTQIAGLEEQIVRTEKEVEIGSRPKSDVYDIKANLGTLQEQWVSAKNTRDLSKIDLLNAISLTKDTVDFQLPEQNLLRPDFDDPAFMTALLENNPAYKAAASQIRANEKNVELAKAAWLPALQGSYSWSTFYSKTLGASAEPFSAQFPRNMSQQVGFSLNIPVFNRFQVKNKVEIARLDVINATYDQQIIINDLMKTLNSIKVQYQNAEEKYALLRASFENQKLSFEKSQEKYREGLMDAYTFFVVRNSWLQANYNLILSKNNVMLQQELLKTVQMY